MKYFKENKGKVEPVELKDVKKSDIIIIAQDDAKLGGVFDEITNLPKNRVLSARYKDDKQSPITFRFPFAVRCDDIPKTLLTQPSFSSEYWSLMDWAYYFTKNKMLMTGAKDWIYEGSKIHDKGNVKDKRKFVRKWGEPPMVDKDGMPSYIEKVDIDLVILTHNDGDTIYNKLIKYEALFKHVVLVDDNSTDRTEQEVERFCKYIEENDGYKPDVKFVKHDLNDDFGKQRNVGVDNCISEWVFHLDSDEELDENLYNSMLKTAVNCNQQMKTVAVFPRKNYLNGVLVNDIPRDKWNSASIRAIKGSKNEPKEINGNPDWQGRLHKRTVRWVRKVHEMVEPMFMAFAGQKSEAGKCVLIQDSFILHPKSIIKQKSQNDRYKKMEVQKNVLFDSVMYTNEGITKHAREEAKGLKNLGWNVFLTDYFKGRFGDEFKEMYQPFDTLYDKYITYVNQPPVRPGGGGNDLMSKLGYQNLVYFLAWEGDILPTPWKMVMTQKNIRKILTPSTYCKEIFENDGVTNVEVVPHGIDSEVFKPIDEPVKIIKDDGLKAFLFVGTWFGGKKDRKGIDILLKAWRKAAPELEDWKLVLKLNNRYFPPEGNWTDSIRALVGSIPRVEVIDCDLSEEDMANLYNNCDTYVTPTRAEGFNIPALEARACGLPVIATGASGHMDFLTDGGKPMKGVKLIKVLRKVPAEARFPYKGDDWHANWFEPSAENLVELMKETAGDIDALTRCSKALSDSIRRKYDWYVISKQMENIFIELLAEQY